MRYVYPCVLHVEGEGTGCPSLIVRRMTVPPVKSLEMAEDALVLPSATIISERTSRCRAPSAKAKSSSRFGPSRAKVALNVAMRDQGVTKVALASPWASARPPQKALGNPDHRSHISTVERALHARRSWAHNRTRLGPRGFYPDQRLKVADAPHSTCSIGPWKRPSWTSPLDVRAPRLPAGLRTLASPQYLALSSTLRRDPEPERSIIF